VELDAPAGKPSWPREAGRGDGKLDNKSTYQNLAARLSY
jgi:hypothetical protein